MFEKVNPSHPDKIADRIAGSIVDLAYEMEDSPKVAVEVLIGHGHCHIIIESPLAINNTKIIENVKRITQLEELSITIQNVGQDEHLEANQALETRCGDNGIFRGMPTTSEQQALADLVGRIYKLCPYDGKYIIDAAEKHITSCQSNITASALNAKIWDSAVEPSFYDWDLTTNPLGYWTGGVNVDSGATNRKLGSDMGDAMTGGGLHGKDLSKADVTLNIIAYLRAQESGKQVDMKCTIGQSEIGGKKYAEYVAEAHKYIISIGGFEKFAEWGLIRPN